MADNVICLPQHSTNPSEIFRESMLRVERSPSIARESRLSITRWCGDTNLNPICLRLQSRLLFGSFHLDSPVNSLNTSSHKSDKISKLSEPLWWLWWHVTYFACHGPMKCSGSSFINIHRMKIQLWNTFERNFFRKGKS